ncbi:protein COFACTOR ASSEMBLY OF COMPLEX C SUBUNIT B CCB2, chloroplastic isoform X1 [Typha latifolia]|uniref:protein COFACTOR ASSEMBLY OF COMPLEX C SUBUNIT B CCB2, chloroplastic isoform X1 n=1 Tax=Typha latifolia TaxID=4733 RepID=UPI003C2C3DFB
MAKGCVSIPIATTPLLRFAYLNPNSKSFAPSRGFSGTRHRHRRCFTTKAQDSNARKQQELNLSVLRFTLGIPGLDESYLPRWIGVGFGSLILLNHFLSSSPTPAQLRSEVLAVLLASFSIALPYFGRFLEGINAVDRLSPPEESRQIFVMSESLSVTQKEDMAWASYVLLRNTNTMSVLIAVNDALCIRGYWNTPEDLSQTDLIEWFKTQIQQTGFLDLKDILYFPKFTGTDSQLGRALPNGPLSLLVQPVLSTSNLDKSLTTKVEGFVLLASNSNYAYGDKDRAWIRAVANKFQGTEVRDFQAIITS